MKNNILYAAVGALVAFALCRFFDVNPFGGVHAAKIVHTYDSVFVRDSIVTTILHHDTIPVPYVKREYVIGSRLDSSICPRIEYYSETSRDTIYVVADCANNMFPIIDVRQVPIIHIHTDTLWKIKETTKVKESETIYLKNRMNLTLFGQTDLLQKGDWMAGLKFQVNLGDLGIFAAPAYHAAVELNAGAEYSIWSK